MAKKQDTGQAKATPTTFVVGAPFRGEAKHRGQVYNYRLIPGQTWTIDHDPEAGSLPVNPYTKVMHASVYESIKSELKADSKSAGGNK